MRKKFLLMLTLLILALGGGGNLFAQNVAKVGNTEYATIDEAIANWTNGSTLTLLADVTLSGVVTLNSTEHHILDLGTYTMTAASGNNAFVIKACGTGGAEQYAITIKADATNPGGINAGSKCVIYYKYADGNITKEDRPIIKIEGGVFTGSTSTWGTAGIYTIGTEARKCATLNISGGTFNCSINGSGKSKLLVSGGNFNYSVGSQGDSTALRLISGGRFKTLGFMTADNKNTKFWFGTSMANSNVGLYVDKDGYLCVGGPVITETSKELPAVASNATKWSSYLAYSSAATYGLFYEDVDMAIAKHGEANVTIWEKPAVTIPEDVTGDAAVVEEIKNNTALEDYTPENLPAGAELEIELKSVGETFVYDVTPMANGVVVEPTEAIIFRLPVPASVTETLAKVYHEGTLMGVYDIQNIQGEDNAKYVEIESADFSEFAIEPIVPVAQIGTENYATLAEALEAAQAGDEIVIIADIELAETIEFPADKTITLNLNDYTISAADKNVVKNSGAALTIKSGIIERTGTVAGYAVNVVSGTLEVEDVTIVGGLYTSGTSLVATNTNISQASASRHAIYAYNCAVTINSGTYHNYNAGNAAVFAYGSSVITIKDGTFSIDNGKQTLGWTSCMLDANAGGKFVINGGTFKGHFRVQANSAMEINGGTFENTHGEAYNIIGTAVVKGGTFTDDAAKTFAKNNVAEGYGIGDNGTVAKLYDGEGTETSPYIINDINKLITLRNEVNGGKSYEGVYFRLTSDITLSSEWTAIGNGSRNGTGYNGNAFKGVFDGGDKTISGLTITSTTGAKAAIGLFGVVDGGTVKNLNLTEVNINVASSDLAGAAIGMMLNGATADNITVSGAIVGYDGVGGIVGRLIIDGTIANCTNNASVTTSYGGIGGIVGKAYYEDGANTSTFANITGCTNKGTIKAGSYAGGIVGLARADVSGCVNEGEIQGGTQTGGIVGQLIAAGTVSGNENKAKVSGTSHVGGIIGDYTQSGSYTYNNVTIANNINRGEISATQQCAAILGVNNIDGFSAMTATGNLSYYYVEGLLLFGNPEDMVIDATNKFVLPVLAKIGTEEYTSFADALEAAKSMTGDVTVEICAKVTMNQPLAGSYTSIKFVGPKTRNNTEAEIYLDVQGYITATGKKVAFENLTLSKSEGGFIANAGFMNVAFGIFDVAEVSYTNCTFRNGAYASSGKVTYTGCTFKKSWDKYGLWAYGNVDVTVIGCIFADYRGIKMYAENGANASVEKPNLVVKNTNFSAVQGEGSKPAIVLTYGESVTLKDNTYSSTGVFELDKDGKPNGVAVTSDVAPTCINDDGACGVLVDGKIYTTVAQAAEVATSGSTVTLLHNSTETVELPLGVNLVMNSFTADNVTITQPFADYVELPSTMNENNYKAMFGTNTVTDGTNYYATLQAAVEAVAGTADAVLYCKPGADVGSLQHAPVTSTLTVYGNNANVTGGERDFDLGNTDPNGGRDITADMTLTVKHLNGCGAWGAKATSHTVNLVFKNCANMGKVFITGTTGTLNITMTDCAFEGVLPEAIYSNADGAISLNNVAFSNLNKAVNLNHKAAGTQTVTINDCSFTDCGNDVTKDEIPVRVLTSVAGGKTVLAVSNTTFSGTTEGGADILLPNDKGVTDATIQTTAANIKEGTAEMKNITEDVVYKYNNAVAKIGETPYASLQAAIDAVNDGETVVLVSDCAEVVSFTQIADESFVIDGNNKIYTGSINITARAGKDAPSTLVIQNFNFNTDAITHDFIKSVETNYYPNNITISGCKFNGTTDINTTDYAVVAVRLKSANNIKIENCTGSGLHSFLQNTAGWNIQIDNVDVTNSLSGFAMGTVQGANIKNCDLVVNKSGIRFDAQLNNNAVITDNEIKAFIPVVVRKASVESAMTFNGENTFTATNTDGLWCAIGTSEYGENGQMPTAATGNVSVTLNDAGLNADGIYGNSINFEGSGTEESPFLINNLNDLKFFRNNVDKQAQDGSTQYAGKYFKLTADIDLAGINWNPIGSMSGDHGSFKGVFDGDNHTISNLKVEQAGNGIGLFARTTGNAVIKNLKLNNVTVESTNNSDYVGGVVGNAFASTKIENVHVTGDVQISGKGYIGGIVGHGYVVMDNVSVVANEGSLITSTFWCAGGILGYAGEGTTNIMNAHVEGLTIKSAAGGLGSIVGMAEDNNGTQPISGSNLSAKGVEIKTYVGGYGTAYENYCIGYLYGGNKTSKLTGELKVENVVLENASGNFPSEISDAVANINGKIYFNLASAIATIGNGDVTINLLRDVTLDYNARDEYGKEGTTSVTINGNNHTLTLNQKNSDWSSLGLKNAGATLTFKNMTIEKTGYGDTSGAWNTHAIIFSTDVVMNNVTVNNAIAVAADATLENVTINEANGYYGLWIEANGQTVTMNGGSITATNGGRGIKIADQYIDTPKQVTLNVTETAFTTAKKAAVLVSSKAGAKITADNVDINNVAADNVNFVWVDEDWAANYGNVEVTGAEVEQEGIENFVAAISQTQDENTNIIIAYYKELTEAIAAVQAGETIELINDITATTVIELGKSITINGKDHKVTSSATRVFRVNANDVEVTLNNVNMVNNAVRVGQNDIRGISIDPSLTNVELTLNNCSVDFTDASACDWAYAVNVSGNGTGHTVTVNGGTYEGANVINVHGATNTVVVKDATLTSLYPDNGQYYGACIYVVQDSNSSVTATGNTFKGDYAVAFNVGVTPLTESNNTDNTGVVARIGDKPYATLEAAFKAATSTSGVCTIDIIKDVTVDYYWDARNTGSKFTVPVTIDGNGKTIKFTNTVYDGGNYMSAFRFEADATVKNLTVDMTDAISGFAGRFRAISAKANLTVDGCTFIGNGSANNTRAIIFGEGAGTNAGNLAISITNSNFEGWKRGISDNENGQDVKTVTITDNTLKDAAVYVSAHNNVTFTDNTVEGAYVNIKSYTDNNKLTVTATGNTLTANVSGDNVNVNKIDAGGVVDAQEEFIVVPKGDNFNGYTSENSIWGEVWGNAKESFVINVLDANNNVMGTTSLNNIGGIIDGDVNVTWNLLFDAAANTDSYWTMNWTTAPNINNMPAKVELLVDGVKVSGGNIQLNGPDNLDPIVAAVTYENGDIKSFATSLANAFAYADNNTVVVLRDITLTETATIAAGKEVVLDLNGHTISQVKECTASYEMISNKGKLTIEGNGKISFKDTGAGDPNFGWGSYTLRNEGTLVVENGTIEHLGEQNPGNGQPNVHMYCAIFQYSGSSTIKGGTISTPTYRSARLWSGDMTIKGGNFVGQLWLQAVNNTSDLTINGGTFTAAGNDGSSVFVSNSSYDVAFAVTGGTFNHKIGASDVNKQGVKGSISGGLFSQAAKANTDAKLIDARFKFEDMPNIDGYYSIIQFAGTQTRELVENWNWFSTYIDSETLLQDLKAELNPNGIQIKGQDGYTQFYSGYGANGAWSPGLTSVIPTKMYMIRTDADVEVELEGNFVEENRKIILNSGWNWIGYPVRESVYVKDAIRNIVPTHGDVIKSQLMSAVFMYGTWFIPASQYGDFYMNPGEGYMYYSNAVQSFDFAYSKETSATTRTSTEPVEYHWIANAAQYPSNMTVIAMLNIDGKSATDNYEIAAFANGECRGSARPVYVDAIDSYVLVMTISGEEVEELTFKYYDVNNGTEYELSNRVNYSSDAILGTADEPYMFFMNTLGIEESTLDMINIYPNPTTRDRAINLQATCDNVEVFNALGVKVAEYQNVDTIDALETAGVYVIRVTINGEVKNCRLVVK